MTDISKHESKEEWEGSHSDDSRVDLLVIGSTIHVNNNMERHSEFIQFEVCGFQEIHLFVVYLLHANCRNVCQVSLYHILLKKGCPEISNQYMLLLSQHIKINIKQLLSGNEHQIDESNRLVLNRLPLLIFKSVEVPELVSQLLHSLSQDRLG